MSPIISDVSQLLEKLLLKELPIRKNGIEISFEQPNREWSSRLSGPTLNVFLYDLRKNKFRQVQWETQRNGKGKGKATQQRAPLRFDLHYIVTAWVLNHDPDEEHYLLTAALLALSRHPRLPDPDIPSFGKDTLPKNSRIDKDFLPIGLQGQPGPIPLLVAEPDELLNPSDIWSALDNDLRPSITCTATMALDPFEPIELDMVRRRELRVRPVEDPASEQQLNEDSLDLWPHPGRELYQVKGSIQSDEPLEDIQLTLVGQGVHGRNMEVPFIPLADGTIEFVLNQLVVGYYKLQISAKNHAPTPYDIIIPTKDSEIKDQKGGVLLITRIKESKKVRE